MKIEESQLSPWFACGEHKPVREGWYLITNDQDYAQSLNAPKLDFPNTVWRYWNGKHWMWYSTKWEWDAATVWSYSAWRGLAETFVFHPMSMLPR